MMKPLLFALHLFVIAPAILGQPLGLALPDMSDTAGGDARLLGWLVLFGGIGVVLALVGYRLGEVCVSELRRAQGVDGAETADPREG